jgi:hypothetical protein
MRNLIIILSIFTATAWLARAQADDPVNHPTLIFELPVFDLPYQIDAAKTVGNGMVSFGSFMGGYANPGMHQSISLTADLYTLAHWGIEELFYRGTENYYTDRNRGKRLLYALTLTAADFLSFYTPGFDGWEHEEYHRAILTRFHVNSFNDMNTFPIGAELVNVSHVKDEDLVRFKNESPADFIRSHAAGIEGEYLLLDKLQRNNFYYSQGLPHELLYFLVTINSISYVRICSDREEADGMTDEANEKETSVEVRDYTGLDFLSWTYDLFRPYENYYARGIHPTGTGIDRYIKTTDLTDEEYSYLRKQGNLQWLNCASPMLLGIKKIRLNNSGLYGNFFLHHYLTSFGNDISCNAFLMNRRYRMFFAFHSYQNFYRSYPAVEAQLLDWSPVFSGKLYISPRILAGLQPDNQEFKTSDAAFIGLAECRLEFNWRYLVNPFAELSVKTAGWVAGNEFLGTDFSCRLGIMSRIILMK